MKETDKFAVVVSRVAKVIICHRGVLNYVLRDRISITNISRKILGSENTVSDTPSV